MTARFSYAIILCMIVCLYSVKGFVVFRTAGTVRPKVFRQNFNGPANRIAPVHVINGNRRDHDVNPDVYVPPKTEIFSSNSVSSSSTIGEKSRLKTNSEDANTSLGFLDGNGNKIESENNRNDRDNKIDEIKKDIDSSSLLSPSSPSSSSSSSSPSPSSPFPKQAESAEDPHTKAKELLAKAQAHVAAKELLAAEQAKRMEEENYMEEENVRRRKKKEKQAIQDQATASSFDGSKDDLSVTKADINIENIGKSSEKMNLANTVPVINDQKLIASSTNTKFNSLDDFKYDQEIARTDFIGNDNLDLMPKDIKPISLWGNALMFLSLVVGYAASIFTKLRVRITKVFKNETILVVTAVLVWYFANFQTNLSSNFTLQQSGGSGGFPVTITCLSQVFGVFASLLYWIRKENRPTINRRDVITMLPLVTFVMGTSLSSVLTLAGGSVSFSQVIKSAEPIFAALVGIFYQVNLSTAKWLCFIPVISGVILSSFVDTYFSWSTLIIGMIANFMTALSINENKRLLEDKKFSERVGGVTNQFCLLTIMSSCLLFLVYLGVEARRFPEFFALTQANPKILLAGFATGFWYFVYQLMIVYVIKKTNPVTQSILNLFKRLLLIIGSAIYLHETLPTLKVFGTFISVFGIFLYSFSDPIIKKYREMRPKKKSESSESFLIKRGT